MLSVRPTAIYLYFVYRLHNTKQIFVTYMLHLLLLPYELVVSVENLFEASYVHLLWVINERSWLNLHHVSIFISDKMWKYYLSFAVFHCIIYAFFSVFYHENIDVGFTWRFMIMIMENITVCLTCISGTRYIWHKANCEPKVASYFYLNSSCIY